MGDSVDRLSQSVRELGHTGRAVGRDFLWHMSNVQTWVSAALTDESTCLDGFAGHLMDGNVKAAIKRRITNVAQVTSNALALLLVCKSFRDHWKNRLKKSTSLNFLCETTFPSQVFAIFK
ncbi:hypothetical protein OIU84_004186 [Salix udensis]|uniref:Pectinesterase inhibitor domain-containing protein n=1 Tax=Salix udensis TaxID=889485 RepID=A0AAD6K1R0_9ROSI|nr:hypothetical protein OIU84_004186 [Salix udensis]